MCGGGDQAEGGAVRGTVVEYMDHVASRRIVNLKPLNDHKVLRLLKQLEGHPLPLPGTSV